MTDSGRTPNQEQQQAIDFREGPLRIIAGAGSGKSTTLVESALALVRDGHARPEQILALTFTDAAAEDLRQKMAAAVRAITTDSAIDVDTYNAFGSRIVLEHGHHLGLQPNLRVLTPGEGFILLWRAIEEIRFTALDLTNMRLSHFGNPSVIGAVLNLHSRLADEDRSLDDYLDWANAQNADDDGQTRDEAADRVAMLQTYDRNKRRTGGIDFADQISHSIRLLELDEVRDSYGDRYRYIMVDEFQDTNYAQRILVRRLGNALNNNVRVVGDPYQAIYGFRGAAPANLDQFVSEDFPDATKITLGVNYRSSQQILDLANELWAEADDASGTELIAPDSRAPGPKPLIVTASSQPGEIAWIASELTRLHDGGMPWSDMVILVRKNRFKRLFWRQLSNLQIPIEAIGGTSLFEQQAVRLIISMLRVLIDQNDDPALAHLLSSDRWGIDDAALYEVGRNRPRDESLFAAAERFASERTDFLAEQVSDCVTTIRRLAQISRTHSLHETISAIQQSLFWTLDDLERESLNRFAAVIDDFEAGDVADPTLVELVGDLDLKSSEGDDTAAVSRADLGAGDTVKIMTVHAAKGLEWPVVFIASAADREFGIHTYNAPSLHPALTRAGDLQPQRANFPNPTQHGKAVAAWKKDELARETRRVAYVAVTRAQDRLYITWRNDLLNRGTPVPLLDLFDNARHCCDQITAPDVSELAASLNLGAFVKSNLAAANLIAAAFANRSQPAPAALNQLSASWEQAGGSPAAFGGALTSTPIRIAQLNDNLAHIQQVATILSTPTEPESDRRLTVSYTSLNEFHLCPHRYYLDHIVGIPGLPGTPATQYGSAVHRAIQTDGEAKLRGESIDLADTWPKAQATGPSSAPAGDRRDPLDVYSNSVDSRARPILTEEPFTMRLPGVDVTGFIDRVQELPDGTVEVVDFKTNWNIPSDEELARDWQRDIYLLAMRDREESLKLHVTQATLVYLRHGVRKSIERDEALLDQRTDDILATAAAIRSLTPTDHKASPQTCQHCDFKRTCRYSQAPPEIQTT